MITRDTKGKKCKETCLRIKFDYFIAKINEFGTDKVFFGVF